MLPGGRPSFTSGYFGNAFVDGDTMYVTVAGAGQQVAAPHARRREAAGASGGSVAGDEMRSTGEVMGIDKNVGLAYMKSQMGAGQILPSKGTVFISVNDRDKKESVFVAKIFDEIGFKIMATRGTAKLFQKNNIPVQVANKVYEGRPNVIDHIKNGEIDLVINTSSDKKTVQDSSSLRQATILYQIPYTTTIAGAKAIALAIKEKSSCGLEVKSIQEYYSP
jgi:carbamoyl-phosphate synthase large subunit